MTSDNPSHPQSFLFDRRRRRQSSSDGHLFHHPSFIMSLPTPPPTAAFDPEAGARNELVFVKREDLDTPSTVDGPVIFNNENHTMQQKPMPVLLLSSRISHNV